MVVDLDHALGVVLWALSDVTLTLRAVGGQRLYAICRDIYDVAQLVARGADMSAALAILPDKAAVPGRPDPPITARGYRGPGRSSVRGTR